MTIYFLPRQMSIYFTYNHFRRVLSSVVKMHITLRPVLHPNPPVTPTNSSSQATTKNTKKKAILMEFLNSSLYVSIDLQNDAKIINNKMFPYSFSDHVPLHFWSLSLVSSEQRASQVSFTLFQLTFDQRMAHSLPTVDDIPT